MAFASDESDEKNSNLETPSSGITLDGLRNVATDVESGKELGTELEANGEGSTTAVENSLEDTIQYPTGFRLAIIIVALILNIFLVFIFCGG